MRALTAACFAAVLGASLARADAPATASAPQFVDLWKQSTAAYQAKDYALMEFKLREALKLRPAHPAGMYNLAAALALKGERKGAMEILETLGAMGLSYEPDKDPDFASLKDSERFKDIVKTFARNARPAGKARTVLQIDRRPTYIPEGIAFDDDEDTYYIGSVKQRRIQRVKRAEQDTDFVGPGMGGLWSAFGMTVDNDRRLLWVATAAVPETEDVDDKEIGHTAIIGYDLKTGDRKRRYALEEPGEHQLGDLTLARNGMLYATDSKAGILYALDTSSGKFEALTKPGELSSPQGIVQSRERRYLYVADYTQGLFRYDLSAKKLERLDVARDICVYGIDGLARYKDDLVVVQNGIRPHRVVQLQLDDNGRRVRYARVLASALPWFDEPTLGVVIGDHFDFVANSQWDRFDDKHHLPDTGLRSPLVLRVQLENLVQERQDDSAGPRPQQAAPAQPGLLPCVGPLCR